MSDDQVTPEPELVQLSEEKERAFDDKARQAGTALRSPAPSQGAALIVRRANHQRRVRVGAATVGAAVLLIVGVAVISSGNGSDEQRPAGTLAEQTSPSVGVTTSVPTTQAEASTSTSSTVSTTPTGPLEVRDAFHLARGVALGLPSFSADGSLYAIQQPHSNDDGTGSVFVGLYDAETLAPVDELQCPSSVVVSNVPGTGDGPDLAWDQELAAPWFAQARTVFMSPVGKQRLCNLTLSPDGRLAATGNDGTIAGPRSQSVWDTSDGSLVAVVPGDLPFFSSDSTRLITATATGFSVWDPSTGQLLSELGGGGNGIVNSPDGDRVLIWDLPESDGSGQTATLYDLQDLTEGVTLSFGSSDASSAIVDASFSRGGDRVALRHVWGVSIWDTSSGAELQRIEIPLGVTGGGVAFSAAGDMVAFPHNGLVRIFDTMTGEQLGEVELVSGTTVFSAGLVFTPNGEAFAVAVDATSPTDPAGVQVYFYTRG